MPECATDDGVRLHFETAGSGPLPVMYLHCLAGSVATWHDVWRGLDDDRFRHIALDFRGHGRSACDPCAVTNERLSRDVLLLADQLGVSRFAVVGHSMGGKVGLRLAAMAPERVSSLTLVGSPGPGLVPLRREDLAGIMANYHDLAVTRAFFRPWFRVWPKASADAWLRDVTALPDWALRATVEMFIWTDIRAEVAGLRVPTLVIAGADDPVYGPAYQRTDVLPCVPHGRMAVVAECGHGLIMEQPARIADLLRPFLAADAQAYGAVKPKGISTAS